VKRNEQNVAGVQYDGLVGGNMRACSFSRLLQLADKQLDLNAQLEVYDHLDRCDICRDAICQISHDRDKAFFIYRAYNVKASVLSRRSGDPVFS
jgi:hypothetical protein